MNFILIILILFFPGLNIPAFHPVHVSVCNIQVDETSTSVAVNLFKDDFALLLKNKFQVNIQLEKADDKQNLEYISKYINECLQIETAKREILKLEYKSSEISNDAIWIHFSAENQINGNQIKIKNTLMLDLWEDQTNLVIIKWKGMENGYRFDYRQFEKDIVLNE